MQNNEPDDTMTAIERAGKELAHIGNDSGLRALLAMLAEEGIKSVPGIGKAWEVSRKIYEGLANIETQERYGRVREYLLGLSNYSRLQMDGDLSSSDLLAILRRLQEDDEATKTRFYVRLTVRLAESELNANQRMHFLRLISTLTLHQIHYARELFIRKTFQLRGYDSVEMSVSILTERKDGMSRQALNTLLVWGLLNEAEEAPGWKKKGSAGYNLTDEFQLLIDFLFHESDLLPTAINEQASEIYGVILVRHLTSADNLFETYLREKLEAQGIRTGLVERVGNVEGKAVVGAHRRDAWAPLYLHTQVSNIDGPGGGENISGSLLRGRRSLRKLSWSIRTAISILIAQSSRERVESTQRIRITSAKSWIELLLISCSTRRTWPEQLRSADGLSSVAGLPVLAT